MKIRLSVHAQYQIRQRQISEVDILRVLKQPDAIRDQTNNRSRFLKQIRIGAKLYMLIVIVEPSQGEIVVVTAFRTSKVEKYR